MHQNESNLQLATRGQAVPAVWPMQTAVICALLPTAKDRCACAQLGVLSLGGPCRLQW